MLLYLRRTLVEVHLKTHVHQMDHPQYQRRGWQHHIIRVMMGFSKEGWPGLFLGLQTMGMEQ